MSIIKAIIKLASILALMAGLILITVNLPETASTWDIVAVNGGGVALVGTSLLILSKMSDADEDPKQKGGKYYGL